MPPRGVTAEGSLVDSFLASLPDHIANLTSEVFTASSFPFPLTSRIRSTMSLFRALPRFPSAAVQSLPLAASRRPFSLSSATLHHLHRHARPQPAAGALGVASARSYATAVRTNRVAALSSQIKPTRKVDLGKIMAILRDMELLDKWKGKTPKSACFTGRPFVVPLRPRRRSRVAKHFFAEFVPFPPRWKWLQRCYACVSLFEFKAGQHLTPGVQAPSTRSGTSRKVRTRPKSPQPSRSSKTLWIPSKLMLGPPSPNSYLRGRCLSWPISTRKTWRRCVSFEFTGKPVPTPASRKFTHT